MRRGDRILRTQMEVKMREAVFTVKLMGMVTTVFDADIS